MYLAEEVKSSGTDGESSVRYALHFLRTVLQACVSEQLVMFVVSQSLTNLQRKNDFPKLSSWSTV